MALRERASIVAIALSNRKRRTPGSIIACHSFKHRNRRRTGGVGGRSEPAIPPTKAGRTAGRN